MAARRFGLKTFLEVFGGKQSYFVRRWFLCVTNTCSSDP